MTFTCQTCNVERVSLDCGPCMAVKLGELCAKEKKRADEAVELLKSVEVVGGCCDQNYCPVCNGEAPFTEREPVHEPGCRLAALIGKAAT